MSAKTLNKHQTIVFGPVPSRRLGKSLGINHVPLKNCTYACLYCQIGHTPDKNKARKEFYSPEDVKKAVEAKIIKATKSGEQIDYLSFVPEGEPTLDINLGKIIDLLKPSGIKIAVITNSSLIHIKDVRDVLMNTDLVSLKIDACSRTVWKTINRPSANLHISDIFTGILDFSAKYKGTLLTETMLISGINDYPAELEAIAEFIAKVNPQKSYISIPTRPPAVKWVKPVSEKVINTAYNIFANTGIDVELLTGYEGNSFAFTGDIKEDILSITAVHPMRKDAVEALLKKSGSGWMIVDQLIAEKKLVMTKFENNIFYTRRHLYNH